MNLLARRYFVGIVVLAVYVLQTVVVNSAPALAAGPEPPPDSAPANVDKSTRIPLAEEINNLPLRDSIVVSFAKRKPADCGVFWDREKFAATPITDTWQNGILDIQADPGREQLGWSVQFKQQPDWSAFRDAALALRVRFSSRMYRRFKVQLNAADTTTNWLVDLSDEEVETLRRRGFGDIRLPLNGAKSAADLKGIKLLSLVFDGRHVATVAGQETKGELKLHSIRLVSPRAAVLEPPARLDDLAARAFEWFERYRDPQSGLTPDRAHNRHYVGLAEPKKLICSIASVGYYLSMLPDAVATGRLSENDARDRSLTVLRFIQANCQHHSGLMYHFIDISTGKPLAGSEVSALDSAIFFNGCMVASVRFGGEVAAVADRLIDRANWNSFRRPATKDRPALLAMGWKADMGLLGAMDVRSTEFMMPYILAVGAQDGGVEAQLWWNTKVVTGTVSGRRVLNPTHGLFTSYYGLGWFDSHNHTDPDRVHLWQNAIDTALANRDFCRTEKAETYSLKWGGWWGISAGDAPGNRYIAPGTVSGEAGGTVWPTTALAALPWADKQIEQDLAAWESSAAWEYVDGPFGLAPFNLDARWIGDDLIGIDLGSFYLAVANQRRRTVWDLWQQHPVARRAIERLYGRR